MIFPELIITRGAQSDAFSIESPTKTIAHVKAVRDAELYARLFCAAPDLLESCRQVRIMLNSELRDYANEPWAVRLTTALDAVVG